MAGAFAIMYGTARFLTDFVRINDERVFGLTGAQYMTLLLVLFGVWVIWHSLRRARAEKSTDAEPLEADACHVPFMRAGRREHDPGSAGRRWRHGVEARTRRTASRHAGERRARARRPW
jgi:ABC-type nickel/cobalt efflux system permease component RcnA